jgi:hypothetical protein
MPSTFTRYAYRCVNAFVFPVPAPATTRILPSVVVTASFWRLFSPAKMSVISSKTFLYKNTQKLGIIAGI